MRPDVEARNAARSLGYKPGLRLTGFFLAAVCLVMFVYVFAYSFGVHKTLLPINALYCGILALLVALFALSALKPRLAWIQPVALLVTGILPTWQDPNGASGVCFFLMGIILLARLGFFERKKVFKMAALYAAYVAVVVAAGLSRPGTEPTDFISPPLFLLAVGLFFVLSYQGRLAVYLKEPKPRISLSEKGLSRAEQAYVLELVDGLSIKEISFEFGVSESTVRNSLAHAYKKLGVEDKAGLAGLAGECVIVA